MSQGNGAGTAERAEAAAKTASPNRSRKRAKTMDEAAELLRRPFLAGAIDFMVTGSYPKDGPTKAIVVPYVARCAVEDRLDYVVGSEHWEVAYVPEQQTLRCRLTILGTTKETYGQGEGRWSQEANAFKRAARLFGVGRYLTKMVAPHIEIGRGPDKVHISGRSKIVPDALAGQLRERYTAAMQAMLDAYGEPLSHNDTPAQAGDEGDPAPEPPVEFDPATGEIGGRGRPAGAMVADSTGPDDDPGRAPAPPKTRGQLSAAVEASGLSLEAVKRLAGFLYEEVHADRLSEEQASELTMALEHARQAEIAEPVLKSTITKLENHEDRKAARATLLRRIEARANKVAAEADELSAQERARDADRK